MIAKLPEILAPAGSLEIMKQAFQAGADAVYLGGTLFGARAFAANLTEEELLYGIEYAKLHDKKLYLTVNTLFKNEDIDRLFAYLKEPYAAGLDAVIVQDFGVMHMIRKCFPELEIHASTQMSITSAYGGNFLKELGVTRIVPARELTLEEIGFLKRETGLELEVFIHGALCYSYSGNCLLSSMIGGRSGNRGRCAQPCRQLYSLSNGVTGYYLSPKDLCGLQMISELMDIGVDSFKIEGRMKKPEYVIGAVEAYRRAVDGYAKQQIIPYEEERERLADIYNRGNFTEGYFYIRNGVDMMSIERNHHNGIRLGVVQTVQGGQVKIQLERDLNHGDVLEIRTGKYSACDSGSGGTFPAHNPEQNADHGQKENREIELTAGQGGKAGQTVTLNGKQLKYIHAGDLVYRTKNPTLCEDLICRNKEQRLKEKINVSVTLKKDLSAMIRMDCGVHSVTLHGDIVTAARKHPLTREVILEKINKLGDAPFVIQSVVVNLDDDCFYSMKDFNQLRRKAILELEQCCRKSGRRMPVPSPEAEDKGEGIPAQNMPFAESMPESVSTSGADSMPQLAVSVSTREQFNVVIDTAQVRRIDLETEAFTQKEIEEFLLWIHEKRKDGYISLPRMFRRESETELLSMLNLQADGYVVRTVDELAIVRKWKADATVVCDYSVYAYNRKAVKEYCQLFDDDLHLTLPVELNRTELEELLQSTGQTSWEWIIYGAQPVMITAQCTQKNTEVCNRKPGVSMLRNTYQDCYRVHRICKYCYNVIYQNQPTCLIPVREELQSKSLRYFRIMLTEEDSIETKKILQFQPTRTGYFGHYRKGIE